MNEIIKFLNKKGISNYMTSEGLIAIVSVNNGMDLYQVRSLEDARNLAQQLNR